MRIAPTTVDFYYGIKHEIADRIVYTLGRNLAADNNDDGANTANWTNQHVCA